ncbi:MAG: hypothetical protein M1453_10020 [Acidobacteria bacterium]|nr:hypothetical protein [Acidobacteriota bacterium]MCL5288313.1 hypothetical protein [Acidobacteriota bacterium]
MILLAALAGGAAGQVPTPLQGTNKPKKAAEQLEISSYPVFEFHSGFWINLHHALYERARVREQRPTARPDRPNATGSAEKNASSEATSGSPAAEERAWNEAVEFYATSMARRDLLLDGEMVDIKNRLADLETCADLSGKSEYRCASGLRPELISALERAAAWYRARQWSEHDRSNRAWIAATEPLVREFGAKLAEQMANVYRAEWPSGKIRVDVCQYAGLVGGYTSLDPLHVTISAADERNQGAAGLEELFHEASHGLATGVRDALVKEFRSWEKPIPRDLWNAILFYTTAEIVKREVAGKVSAAAQKRSETADRYGLATRGWQNFQTVLERHWKPYLDALLRGRAGPDDYERALAQVAASL